MRNNGVSLDLRLIVTEKFLDEEEGTRAAIATEVIMAAIATATKACAIPQHKIAALVAMVYAGVAMRILPSQATAKGVALHMLETAPDELGQLFQAALDRECPLMKLEDGDEKPA